MKDSPFDTPLPSAFWVQDWLVQPQMHQVSQGERVVPLEPKVMEVLVYLAQHAGEVVTREALLTDLWPGVIVQEDALTRCISRLRKVFGDSAQNPRYIQTIRKRGYRLLPPVRLQTETTGDSAFVSLDTLARQERVAERQSIKAARPALAPLHAKPFRRVGWLGALLAMGMIGVALFKGLSDPPQSIALSETYQVTALVGEEVMPALSPNGQMVAFASQGSTREGFWDLYVKGLRQPEALRLTNDMAADYHPTWSPDGQTVAFMKREGAKCQIHTVSMLGGASQPITSCRVALGGLRWSLDGQFWIYPYEDPAQQTRGLVRFSLATRDTVRLTSHPFATLTLDYLPAISPDNQIVSFIRLNGNSGSQDLYQVALAGGISQRITSDQANIEGQSWSPDGHHLFFSSNRGGTFELWKTNVQGHEIVQAGLQKSQWPGRIDIRGDHLIYEEAAYSTNIWSQPLATEQPPVPLVQSTGFDLQPTVSPDGQHLAFVSDRSGSLQVWTSKRDGTGLVEQTRLNARWIGMPRWSPDGDELVFAASDTTYTRLFRLALNGQAPTHLPTHVPSLHPVWVPDGKAVYYAALRSKEWHIERYVFQSGQYQSITNGYKAEISSDGLRLYVSKPAGGGLWQFNLTSGKEAQVLPLGTLWNATNWTLAETGIYFAQAAEGTSAAFAYFDFDTERTTPVADTSYPLLRQGANLTLAPEAHALLYTQVDQRMSDLYAVALQE